jgi:hypothetical protein
MPHDISSDMASLENLYTTFEALKNLLMAQYMTARSIYNSS